MRIGQIITKITTNKSYNLLTNPIYKKNYNNTKLDNQSINQSIPPKQVRLA